MGGKWLDSQSLVWTTRDEINSLRSLAKNGNVQVLLNYYRCFQYRSFNGEGMRVDRREVAKALRVILSHTASADELRQVELKSRGVREDAKDILRTAAEWLGGGNLRAMSQRRKGDDSAGKREVPMP